KVEGSGSNYVFTFDQPNYGAVQISWTSSHGITDIGYPSSLPFDDNGPGATWVYNLDDRTAPIIAARAPQAGATVTNLTQISVAFSEAVAGVDAADLLINGTGAFGVNGTGSNYVFSFFQPEAGFVSISWTSDHGIRDLAASPNPFDANGPGATWTYILDTRTFFVQSNSMWLFVKGTNEVSTPVTAWRQLQFDDSSWSNTLAPFYYGDPYPTPGNPGTLLSDMQNNGYSSIFLRQRFFVQNAFAITNLFLAHQSDDGFIAWINGFEVWRHNMPDGEVPYNGSTLGPTAEQNSTAPYIFVPLPDPALYLRDGTNVLVVHAFNVISQPPSSDFGFNAQLFGFVADPTVVPPGIAAITPTAGALFYLTNITIRFTESVSGVNPGDLLINGAAATSLESTTNTTYTFSFAQPDYGPVTVTWASGHGIVDFDSPPKPFDGIAPGSLFQYDLLNPSAPTVATRVPAAGSTINELTEISVTFSEPVTGVNASDFLVNGIAATSVTGSGANYTFAFAQPAYGPVAIGWTASHGIADLELPANPFDATRQGSAWSYTLVDQTPPVIAALNPPAGAQVTNLTQVAVTFSEPVTGINATDLLVNGAPATSVSGADAIYVFAFAQANATVVNFTWANNHGIRDLAPVPNAFDANGPGATWSYSTPDTLAPSVVAIDPAPFVTVRSLTQIRITFSEPVVGVGTNDLLINGRPPLTVNGSGAGPYTFSFLPPTNGAVDVKWIVGHEITDLADPPNPFDGGEWTYILDPNATFAGKVILSEIMFNSRSGLPADEWIELQNVSDTRINLTGWRFSRGIDFTFPNVPLDAGGYLVVAANVEAFQANYPGVTNVVGGWTGRLANSDETIELETVLGEVVNRVHYATEGDWARRERGHGAAPVTSIFFGGANATVTVFAHGFSGTDRIMISGADQPEYNGIFAISGISPSTFNIAVPGAPASPATGNIIARHVIDNDQSGWSWFSAADGFGSSLELVNAALPNTFGQNWLSSTNLGGTPGRSNSVARGNIAPLILEVTHSPPVPRSTDVVAITARIRDESTSGVQSATLWYRDHSSPVPGGPFISTAMLDDGAHGDGAISDGLFGALLPPAPNGTIIEFYVQAADTNGLSRAWPAPTWETNNTFAQLANALYQVDDEILTDVMPSVRLVMSASERATFPPNNRNSDAEMNVTFIGSDGDGTTIHYLAGVRVRGAGSRTRNPPNNRVNIPNDNRWNDLQAINLNGQYVHAQVIGAAVARKSGVPASDAHIIQYRINGINPAPITPPGGGGNGAGYGAFVMVEPVNGDFAADLYPEDGDGNVYRASTGGHSARLDYLGTNPNSYLGAGYFKTSNQTENDWTDLMNLTFAFSQVGSEEDYVQAISTNVNVTAWMRYFALGTLINFGETSMFNGRGDDYALYRGINDPRFVAIGHDFDTIFGQGDTMGTYTTSTNSSIYIMLNPPNTGGNAPNMPLLRRFLTNGVFSPIFFAELKRLTDTVFSPEQLNPLMDQMLTWPNGPSTVTIDAMKRFAANRRSVVLSQIPLALTVSSSLNSSNGLLYTATPNVTLFGASHAIDTRRVLVNGAPAGWSTWNARWTNTLTLLPGINRVLVQSLYSNNLELARAMVDIWYDDGSVQSVSGNISADTVWAAGQGPYQVTGNVTVNAGATLTIQPGTTIYLAAGVGITVANGGRLLAEGTDTARILFTRAPGAAGNWDGITINGGPSSPETRIAYAHFDFNGDTAIHSVDGTVFLDHLTFGNTSEQYVSLDRSSFVVQDCVFPDATTEFELVHGSGGIKPGGRGIFLRNFFGSPIGYNDTVDFTGGSRPGPIVQFINNVFVGTDDDILDLDAADAWIERNIFLHVHRNGSPDSASAISGGTDNSVPGQTSEITVVGNLFYDVDHAANAKQGNFYTFINNTIVRQTRTGGVDTDAGVITLADEGTALGAGFYLEGNIIYDAEKLVRTQGVAVVTFTNNIMPFAWSGPGGNNLNVDPLFNHVPQFSETTNFNSWASAQVLWHWFSLKSGSPAQGAGPNGRDIGGVISLDVSISGEPAERTPANSATLYVGVNRTGSAIPTTSSAFPDGSGFTHYRWRLDGGAWSPETPTANPISLSGLSTGPHYVEVAGKRDSGFYQDDPVYGGDAVISLSRTWTVDSTASRVRINEILASNGGALVHNGGTPDAIELHNASDMPVDLTGMRLTDDLTAPDAFIFPAGASIPARGYLVVYGGAPSGPGFYLGFGLNQDGDSLYLFAAETEGGALVDSVTFGNQLTDLSIGRMPDGNWALTQPTFGTANRAAQIGSPGNLRINEWLAIGETPFNSDFIELYNTESLPVPLGGLYITDEILGWPDRHQLAPLTFIAPNGYLRLFADGDTSAGANHLNFNLEGEHGTIGLYLSDLSVIDCVWYQPQRVNISQGRSPNGGPGLFFFDTPTPGAPNPIVTGPLPFGGALVINEVLALNGNLVELNGRTPDWVELYNGHTETADLSNLSLTDDPTQTRRFVFPAGTQIPPGGYLRIFCDNGQPPSTNNTGFGLSSTGGGVYLFDNPATGGTLLNSIVYGVQTADLSIGRIPSGGSTWRLNTPTPNAANSEVPTLGDSTKLKVNEWMADPAPGEDDWFEIYNPNPLPVALGGLHLTDDLNARTKHQIAALSFIGSGTNAYIRFRADGNTGAGADHVSFSLRGAGEAVGISSATGVLIDRVTFGQQLEDISQGLFPDGTTNIVSFPLTASPGRSNYRRLT
ncbi:MAG: lamin tail domain-containing protein, partial [Verrucomicrobia subdivision 3 bacterium]|nr:lamin tail domain-containing protein [Limisphaerales bacterium]